MKGRVGSLWHKLATFRNTIQDIEVDNSGGQEPRGRHTAGQHRQDDPQELGPTLRLGGT